MVSIQAAIERLQGSLEWLDKGLPAWSQLIVVAASVDSGTVQCNDQRSGVLRNIPWGQQLQVKLPSATALDGDLHIIVSSPFGPCNADVSLGELHSMSCSGGGVINCKAIPFVQPVAEDKVGNARKFAVQVTCAVEGLAPLAPVPEQSPVLPLQSPLMEGVGEAASLAGGAVCMEGHDCSHCNHAPHSGFGTPVKAHGSSEKGKQMDWLPRVSPLALPTAAAVAAAALLTPIPQLHATLLALVLLFLAALAVLSPTSSPAALVAEPSPKIAEAPKTEGADEAPTGAPASPRGHSPFEVPISPPSVKPSRPTPSPFHTTAPAPVEGIVVCVRLMRACVMEGLDDIETDVMDLDEVDESGDELTSLERPKLGRTAAKVLDRRITRRMSNLCTASNDVIDLSTARGPRQVLGPAPMSGPVFSHMMSFHPLASSYTDDEATAEERASLRLLTARTPLDVDDQFQRQLDMVRGDRVEALQRVQDTVVSRKMSYSWLFTPVGGLEMRLVNELVIQRF